MANVLVGLYLIIPLRLQLIRQLAPDAELRLLHDDRGVRLDGGGEPDAAADDAVVADDRFAAEDGRVGVDHHAVFNRWVPLVAADQVAVVIGGKAEGPQRHALINLDVIADFARLANHHAGAVVDEEVIADGRAGVNVDASLLGTIRRSCGE